MLNHVGTTAGSYPWVPLALRTAMLSTNSITWQKLKQSLNDATCSKSRLEWKVSFIRSILLETMIQRQKCLAQLPSRSELVYSITSFCSSSGTQILDPTSYYADVLHTYIWHPLPTWSLSVRHTRVARPSMIRVWLTHESKLTLVLNRNSSIKGT